MHRAIEVMINFTTTYYKRIALIFFLKTNNDYLYLY